LTKEAWLLICRRMTNLRKLFPFLNGLAVCLAAIFLTAGAVFAQQESDDIQKMMSPGEFKAAGLDKLSSEELEHLNAWLKGYRETTVQAAEKKATKEGRRKIDVLVSRIVGPFYGLTGSTIITLEDGTKWKQANKNDRYKGPGLDNLGVAVFNAGLFGYKMRIQGTQEFYVDQVRSR
jgi:hypothetical protein